MHSIILALFVAFLWGMSPIIFKHLLGDIDIKVIMLLSSVIYASCVILYVIPYWSTISSSIKKLTKQHMALIAINAIFMMFMANVLFLFALKYNSKTYIVTAIAFCAPLFSLLIAYLFLKQKITWMNLVGISLTIMGIIILSYFQ